MAVQLHLPAVDVRATAAPRHLEAERLYLREVRTADVNDTYHRWMNDPDVTRYLESRFYPSSMEGIADFVASLRGDRNNVFLAIMIKQDHRHIGNIKLGPINWIHRTADIGLLIGEKDCWGQGYAAEAIRCLRGYAFSVLNLHKLTASCYDCNLGSARAFLKAGFHQEGTRKEQFFCEGRYVDQVLLGLCNT